MKNVFIVNPAAGQGNNINKLVDKLNTLTGIEKEIYITKDVGDATRFVKEYCKSHGVARFIACGGDGTFGETLNGAIDHDGAEIGIIPIGTGNDFCRNFDGEVAFNNVMNQVNGECVKCDAIRYTTTTSKGPVSGYCANMFNIGFDCNVADLTAKMKKRPLVSGSMAYLFSIFVTLIRKKGANLKIEIDGEERYNGKLLLTSIANGSYCGGGVKSNPLALVSDGKINVNIIKNVPRYKFIYLFPFYKKGTHLKVKNIDKVIMCEDCSTIEITPLEGRMRICVDGEIIDAGKTTFEICPSAFNFVVPCVANNKTECLG